MFKKIATILGKILKGVSCRSACCIESSCNKKQKDEIIDEVVDVAHDIIDAVKITSV